MPNDNSKEKPKPKPSPKPEFIKNYGLFWKRNDIAWRVQDSKYKRKGFFGKENDNKDSPPINFAEQVGFYALYDEFFNLIYFGQVGAKNNVNKESADRTMYMRLSEHCKSSLANRWFYFSWFGMKSVKGDKTLDECPNTIKGGKDKFLKQVEAIVLEVASPSKNKQSGAFSGAKKYFQHGDKRLSLSVEERLKKIQEQLNGISNQK